MSPRVALLLVSLVVVSCRGRVPPEPVPEAECTTFDGCDGFDVCANTQCEAPPRCLSIDDWPFCREALNALEPGLGRTAICVPAADDGASLDFFCRPACETDAQCSAGSLCTDFGRCVPGLVRTPQTPTPGAHAPLIAGVFEVPLDVPATTCLGGFSSRAGSGDGAWADGMDAAVGHLDGLDVRAAYLDVGDGALLVIRMPIIFPTAALTEAVAQRLEADTGRNLRDALVINATHTHSGPARFLPLLDESEALLGPFGIGTFRQEVFDRMVQSAVDAARGAIDAAAPAALGVSIVEAFDVDDRVAADRRSDSPEFDDNRALVVRVDDDAGLPLFVLFSTGVHPTENGSAYATNDVVGGFERAVEAALYPVAGRVVPALFLQGNGGSMAPTASGQGFLGPTAHDYAGVAFVDALGDTLTTLATSRDVQLRARTHRFFINSPLVGYGPGEWSNDGEPPFGGEVTYGGMNCFRDVPDDGDTPFSGALTRSDMGCGIAFHTFLFNHPPSVFERSQIHAIDIDGTAIVALPGELSMELSWDIAAALQERAGLDPLHTFTIGYTNDHVMYLLPTTLDEDAPPYPGYTGPAPSSYPPFAFSPFRGGYEADTQIWGDLFGDYLKQETLVAWQRMIDGAGADVEVAPAVYSPSTKDPIAVDDTADAGTVVLDLPTSIARRAPVEFAIHGGDVAVEGGGPVFTVISDDDETAVLLPSGRPMSSAHMTMPVRVSESSNTWTWTARLELPVDMAAGTYRLRATGKAQRDGAVVDYVVDSAAFSVVGGALVVRAARTGADVEVVVGWDNPAPSIDEATITGPLSLVDARVPHGRLAPLRAGSLLPSGVVVTVDGVATAASSIVEGERDGVPATVAVVVGVGAGAIHVDVTDAAGNHGSVDVQ
jgi:hypothetical protein